MVFNNQNDANSNKLDETSGQDGAANVEIRATTLIDDIICNSGYLNLQIKGT